MSAKLELSLLEDLDVEDLVSLPRGFRYELHYGNLVVRTPSTFWHKAIAGRLVMMLTAAGLNVFQHPGVRGARPRDCRLPDVGVVPELPPGRLHCSTLAPSYYTLVVEIFSKKSPTGECRERELWYAEHRIPEYWVVEEDPAGSGDGLATIMKLNDSRDEPGFVEQRRLLLSELEAECRG